MTQDYKERFPIGSQWKCRDGSRAVIVDNLTGWNSESKKPHLYHHCGGVYGFRSEKDIISEWQEPRTIEGWVNVYDDGFGGCFFDSLINALKAGKRRTNYIKTIRITYNEQDGVTATVEENK